MLTYIEMSGQTELKYCDYVIQGDHKAVSLKHRPCVAIPARESRGCNITASTPNANYLR